MFTAKIVGFDSAGVRCAEIQTAPLNTELFESLHLFEYEECCNVLREECPKGKDATKIFVVYHNHSRKMH